MKKTKDQLLRVTFIYFQKVLDGAIRHISPETREKFAKKEFIYKDTDGDFIEKSNSQILENLKINGFSSLGVFFEPNEISEALNFFSKQEYFDAQVPTQGNLLPKKDFLKNYIKKSI